MSGSFLRVRDFARRTSQLLMFAMIGTLLIPATPAQADHLQSNGVVGPDSQVLYYPPPPNGQDVRARSTYTGYHTVRVSTLSGTILDYNIQWLDSGDTQTVDINPALTPGFYNFQLRRCSDLNNECTSASSNVGSAITIEVKENQPATGTAITPATGATWNASSVQEFSYSATDPEGAGYTAQVEIQRQDGSAWTTVDTILTGTRSSGVTYTASPSFRLSRATYQWRLAQVCDVGGSTTCTDTAYNQFSVSGVGPFQPDLVSPAAGATITDRAPQPFVINSWDADGDPYTGKVFVRDAVSKASALPAPGYFLAGPAASHEDATGVPMTPLSAGTYEWTALAFDADGESAIQAWRSLTVTTAGDPVPPNAAPSVPSLLAPANDATLPASGPHNFSLSATDADGDAYRGLIDISTGQGAPVATLLTDEVASGATASASTAAPLREGDYRWTAWAIDARGAVSDPSSTRMFTVGDGDPVPPPPANTPPAVPTLGNPTDGAALPVSGPHSFSLSATDADGDAYRGQIDITTSAGVPVATLITNQAASGGTASASTVAPLPAGSYRWTARAVDERGGASGTASMRTFTVGTATTDPVPSEDCTGGDPVVDGYMGGAYVRVGSRQADDDTLLVCFRADGMSVEHGGRFTVVAGAPSTPQAPSTDDDWEACRNADPSSVVMDGFVGPETPAGDGYTHVAFHQSADEVWLCLNYQGESVRVIVPTDIVDVPPVPAAFAPDPPGAANPDGVAPPPGPSATCRVTGVEHLNATLSPAHVWLGSWVESSSRAHVCVRVEGITAAGGRLTLDTSVNPGVSPVVSDETLASKPADCSVRLNDTATPNLGVYTTPAGANPGKVCVRAGGSTWRVITLGTSGSLAPTLPVAWTPDPGTPG